MLTYIVVGDLLDFCSDRYAVLLTIMITCYYAVIAIAFAVRTVVGVSCHYASQRVNS